LKWHEHSSIRTFIASDTFISKPDHCGKSLHVRKSISLVIKWEGIGLWWNAHAIIWKRITIINHSFLPYMNYSYWFFFFLLQYWRLNPELLLAMQALYMWAMHLVLWLLVWFSDRVLQTLPRLALTDPSFSPSRVAGNIGNAPSYPTKIITLIKVRKWQRRFWMVSLFLGSHTGLLR
jgi:hypothetical protein